MFTKYLKYFTVFAKLIKKNVILRKRVFNKILTDGRHET